VCFDLNLREYLALHYHCEKHIFCAFIEFIFRISEELLNESLLGVAREIEVNDIVEKLFKEELQL